MDYRKKFHKLVGLQNPRFGLEDIVKQEKHRCNYCQTRQNIALFSCISCTRKTVQEKKDALTELEAQREKKHKQIAKYVESVKGTYEQQKKQRILDQSIKRLEHLREFVQNQRNELQMKEEKLQALKKDYELRLVSLEQTHRSSRQTTDSVRTRVPEASSGISSTLKIRRENLRNVLRDNTRKLDKLYPIRLIDKDYYTIARLPLPSRLHSENLTRQKITSMREHLRRHRKSREILLPKGNESQQTLDPIFAALGYVVLLCKLLSHYLATPLPFKMRFRGCHSFIEDHDDVRHGLHLPRHRSSLFADEDDQFQHVQRAIVLLDHNIRHLCLKFSLDRQRIKPLAILPNLFCLCELLCSDKLSDSELVTTAQDREIFHPFSSAAGSGTVLRKAEQDEEDVEEDDDFVVVDPKTEFTGI